MQLTFHKGRSSIT